MFDSAILFVLTGVALFAIGLRGVLLGRAILVRILAINVCSGGVFLAFVAAGYRGPGSPADPVPHALVLTGIVVAISATALALALVRRLWESRDD